MHVVTTPIDPGAVADAAIRADIAAGNVGNGGGAGGDATIARPELAPAIEGGIPVNTKFIPGAVADKAIDAEYRSANGGRGGSTVH